ncbi:MAG: prepilin-type N-terminal cleavage/methylation domain-containing protein [bacterium]|nr:prepilin-type N-terminal cleavage/methylation domain-containing protein [bacterium]
MISKDTKDRESGQSLIEVLVALVVAALVITALIITILTGLKNSQFAQKQSQATKYAQEAIDKIRGIRDRDVAVTANFGSTSVAKFSDLWSVQISASTDSSYFTLGVGSLSLSQVPVASSDVDLGDGLSRQIMFWDDATSFALQKQVTVKVKWTDSSGSHESNLQTIITPR